MYIKPISNLTMFLFALVFTGGAQATVVNLTTAPTVSGDISDGTNTLTFVFDKQQPSGTGVLNPFVRIQENNTEQGYNTTQANAGALPFEEKFGNFTHDLRFSDLEIIDGFYQFVLDIGEPVPTNDNQGQQSLLSLDGLKFFSTPTPGQNNDSVDVSGNWTGNNNTLLWNMDGSEDSHVLLDSNRDGNPGNGVSDMLLKVPTSVFANVAATDYIILWSRFGLQQSANAGSESFGTFEEWAQLTDGVGPEPPQPPDTIPEPATVWLLGLGLLGLAGYKRRQDKLAA